MEKFLQVEPFNDLYYKDCFYSALFPAIRYFERPIHYFMAFDRIAYKKVVHAHEWFPFQLQTEALLSDAEILKRLSIRFESKRQSEDIVTDLIHAIQHDSLPLVRVDCYYLSIRKDLFRKEHWPHTILICGFDMQNRIFYGLEHREREQLNYERRIISFEDLQQAYAGFCTNYLPTWSVPSIYFCSTEAEDHSPYSATTEFIAQILKDKELLLNYEPALRELLTSIENMCLDESRFEECQPELLKELNAFILVKQIELYRLSLLLDAVNVTGPLKEQLFLLNRLRGIVGKYSFTQVYPYQAFKENVIFDSILSLEKIYVSALLEFVEDLGVKELVPNCQEKIINL